MKQIYTLLTLVLLSLSSFAQTSTKGFSFQGYAIDPDGKALGSTAITVQFTVAPSTGTGGTYVETHALTSDAYGVFSAVIGEGSKVSGADFKTLDFTRTNTRYKLKVEVKRTSGGTYATINDSDFNAVPYSRHADNGVPVGTIISYAGPKSKIPEGWALCDGSSQDGTSTQWKQLFDILGTTWGGSGNNFNLPDLRGMFLRGVNDGRTGAWADPAASSRTAANTGGNTGDNAGTVQTDDNMAHTHTGTTNAAGTHNHNAANWGLMRKSLSGESNTINTTDGGGAGTEPDLITGPSGMPDSGSHTHTFTSDSSGSESRPNNASVYYIIKY